MVQFFGEPSTWVARERFTPCLRHHLHELRMINPYSLEHKSAFPRCSNILKMKANRCVVRSTPRKMSNIKLRKTVLKRNIDKSFIQSLPKSRHASSVVLPSVGVTNEIGIHQACRLNKVLKFMHSGSILLPTPNLLGKTNNFIEITTNQPGELSRGTNLSQMVPQMLSNSG